MVGLKKALKRKQPFFQKVVKGCKRLGLGLQRGFFIKYYFNYEQ